MISGHEWRCLENGRVMARPGLYPVVFQECFLMTAMHLIPQIQSLVYNASTCLIRFLYVRSSLQVNIQEVYRRNQFTLMFILIGEGINVFNLVSALYYRKIFTE